MLLLLVDLESFENNPDKSLLFLLQEKARFSMTEEKTDHGEYIVLASSYCSDGSLWWQYCAVGWNVALLLAGSVLSFQNKSSVGTFNESKTLALLIYSNFLFVCMRFITYILSNQVDGTLLDQLRSLIYRYGSRMFRLQQRRHKLI